MIAKHEVREYTEDIKVFLARYVNLNNILHWHYDCELVYVASGSLEVYASGRSYSLSAGQTMYIGNMEEHSIRTKTKAEVYMVIFNYDILKGMIKNQKLLSPALSKDYGFLPLYELIKNELTAKEKYYDCVIENKIAGMILEIFRNEKSERADIKKKDKMAFMRLLDDIDKNFNYYTGENAAKFLYVSKIYFSKYFHKMSGMVFTDYLNTVKISKAVEMMQNDKNAQMSEVATKCGFNTIRNFNRVFKEITGFQPTQLPDEYAFTDTVFFSADSELDGFDPTLRETVLVESLGGTVA